MARMLSSDGDPASGDRFGAQAVFIGGALYDNSAAKFWTGLADEILADYPECDEFALTSPSGEQLSRSLLFPETALLGDLGDLVKGDMDSAFRATIAELEILGPPSPVTIRLLAAGDELYQAQMPTECVDAEVFEYLSVWLLEWAAVPEMDWNNETLAGDVRAEDFARDQVYLFAFRAHHQHLCEGLYRRDISLRVSCEPA